MQKHGILRRSMGWLVAGIAALLILLAVVVGIARLLLPLAPEYRDQIRQFATDATGFDVRFAGISASWPFRGPELRFSGVRIATKEGQRTVLDARELSIGVNFWRLLVERRLRPGRVAVKGARVRAERLPAGQWLINAVPLEELFRRPRNQPLPHLEINLQNIELLLLDPSRLEPRVALSVGQLDLELAPEVVGFDAEVEGPEGLGTGIVVTGSVPASLLQALTAPAGGPGVQPVSWNVQVQSGDLDVARLLRILANEPVPLTAGRGDVAVEASFVGLKPDSIAVDLELGPTTWQGLARADNNFERLDLQAAWKETRDGWEANLRRFAVERAGKASPASSGTVRYWRDADGIGTLAASASNFRAQDFWPLVWSVASSGLRRDLLPERLQGEVRDFKLSASLAAGKPPAWTAEASFRNLGLVMPAPGFAVAGLSGTVRADESGGRIDLRSGKGLLRFPSLFRADIRSTAATGQLGWKRTERGLEILADDLLIATADAESRSRVQLIFPPAGPVFVDIAARFVASSAPAALNYLPLQKFRPGVVTWLDRAVVAGSVPSAELLWQGPLRGFPYEAGDGRFRAEFTLADAVIDYAADWPRLENVTGTVVIDRVSLASVENRGSIGGLPFQDASIHVANLVRDAELEVAASNQVELGQIFGFLRQTPVATLLGPTLESVTGSGAVSTAIDLRLPIARAKDYRLTGSFGLEDATLGLGGMEFGLTSLAGTVRLDTDRLLADGLTARFLDEPVTIDLRRARPDEPGLTQVADARGETPAGKLAAAFSLPYADKLAGSVAWDAAVQVPARAAERPVTVRIASGLEKLASTLAPPLAKPAGVAEPLRMEVRLPGRGLLQVYGRIERGISWALQFRSAPAARPVASGTVAPGTTPSMVQVAGGKPGRGVTRQEKGGWRLERGVLRGGGAPARLPADPGLEIGGNFASLRFEDWFPGRSAAGNAGEPDASALLSRIDVETGSLAILGRVFRNAGIDARRASGQWRVAVRGPSAAGTLTVPVGRGADEPIVLDMERLWLVETDPAAGEGSADPRNLPPVRASVADFVLKDMHLGRLNAELAQRGDGVVVEPLALLGRDFRINGDATWVVEDNDPGRQRSELSLQLQSTNIAPTLEALGYEPVIEGEKASLDLDLFWPGGPSDDFLNAAGGRIAVDMAKGRFLPVDPGSGRLVGLLSIAMLPRRLFLDFSDVVDKGLAFDKVKGEFRLDRGNAFTCNFGLEGPAADIGILGRASIRDRSFDQLAVTRPHVSDMLAVGGFVGGPVVGSTVLLISQIFRKPLSSLGETYYRISGGWDQPVITKVQKSDVDVTPFQDCERYLAEALRQLPPEAELTR